MTRETFFGLLPAQPSKVHEWAYGREWFINADFSSIQPYWNNLPPDPYVMSGERLRRYAVALHEDDKLELMPEEPHVQALAFNRLFGGVDRFFAPIEARFFREPALRQILSEALVSIPLPQRSWRLQFHQFRISAPGVPTPEGVHRDGAKYVLMVMMRRERITGGMTFLYENGSRKPLAQIMLARPGHALLIDDESVLHYASPIAPHLTGGRPAYRDMLVVTFHDQHGSRPITP